MTKYDWSKYNLKRDREAICQLKEYSKNSKKIPPIQKGLYNHIRDIYALAILNSKNSKKKIDILDYGGNLISNLVLKLKGSSTNGQVVLKSNLNPPLPAESILK